MSPVRFLAILAILLLLPACSGSGDADAVGGQRDAPAAAAKKPAASISDPCKLLSNGELSAALGTKYGAGELTNTGAGPRCRFFTTAQDEAYIDVDDPALFEAYAHSANQTLPGVGDKALWEHTEYGSFLYVMKGGELVTVGLPRSVATPTPAIESLGKLIASRM